MKPVMKSLVENEKSRDGKKVKKQDGMSIQ